MSHDVRQTSKFLSDVLRHRPDEIGAQLDEHGWIDIDELLAKANAAGRHLTRQIIAEAVRTSDKQRFRISDDGTRIRASQGHSIEIHLDLPARTPPDRLYHGTAERCLDSILATGIDKRARQHVHLSADIATAQNVGTRHGRPVVLIVDSDAMHRNRHTFFCSDNGVWLTDHVPSKYLQCVVKD